MAYGNKTFQLEFHIRIPHSSNQYTVFYIHCYDNFKNSTDKFYA